MNQTGAKRWADLLESDVYARLANCKSRKADILPLAQAKWAIMKSKPEMSKEDALISVLELLDCNSTYIDLTKDEYDDILNQII